MRFVLTFYVENYFRFFHTSTSAVFDCKNHYDILRLRINFVSIRLNKNRLLLGTREIFWKTLKLHIVVSHTIIWWSFRAVWSWQIKKQQKKIKRQQKRGHQHVWPAVVSGCISLQALLPKSTPVDHRRFAVTAVWAVPSAQARDDPHDSARKKTRGTKTHRCLRYGVINLTLKRKQKNVYECVCVCVGGVYMI